MNLFSYPYYKRIAQKKQGFAFIDEKDEFYYSKIIPYPQCIYML